MDKFINYYIEGKFINIKKLKSDHLKTEFANIPLTITNIKIYEIDTKTYQSKLYNNEQLVPDRLIMDETIIPEKNYTVSTSSSLSYVNNGNFLYKEPNKDNDPYINITLNKVYKISKIVITFNQSQKYNKKNIINTMIEVLNETNTKEFSKIINDKAKFINNTITISMKCHIEPKDNLKRCNILECIPCNPCPPNKYAKKSNNTSNNTGCPTETKCKQDLVFDLTLADFMTGSNKKIEGLKNEVDAINDLMNNILNKPPYDLNEISVKVQNNKRDLKAMNTTLENAVSMLGPLTKIVQIIPPKTNTETFTNYNYKGDNLNLNMMSINSNDVSQFTRNVKSNKDKQMEKFAGFVQPKINVYEGFFDWQSDTAFTSKIPYQAPSSVLNTTITPTNRVSNIPIVKNQNIEQNLNEYTAKILAMNIKNKANQLNASWITNN